jgi:hypothetical protein
MKLTAILAAGLSASAVVAHSHVESRSEVQRKATISKRCAGAAGQFNRRRVDKRMTKRALEHEKRYPGAGNATYEITTEVPYYQTIQNDTCVLTPETTMGPYVWPRSETLRQDMTEGQAGVPLWLDIGGASLRFPAPAWMRDTVR